jgi:hypothetical protein
VTGDKTGNSTKSEKTLFRDLSTIVWLEWPEQGKSKSVEGVARALDEFKYQWLIPLGAHVT